jgi:hypothetical protein
VAGWVANGLALAVLAAAVGVLGLGLLWRIGAWQLHPAAMLTLDEGLRPGSVAPEIACFSGEQEMHLSFSGRQSFIVFGGDGCEPCSQLLAAAAAHPATRHMRLVYVSDGANVEADPDVVCAPVSPYFHIVGDDGRVLDKGIANRPEHLDRLLRVAPPSLRPLQLTTSRR